MVVEPTDYLPAGCVRMDVFSADEQAAIAALREQVLAWIDAGETAEPTADGTEAAQYLDDATLWRYAKARECDTEQALEMFKSSLCWKRETGIKQVWAQCTSVQHVSLLRLLYPSLCVLLLITAPPAHRC